MVGGTERVEGADVDHILSPGWLLGQRSET
jgi:hypothetical protein